MAVVFTFFETMDGLRSVLSKDEVAKFEECWAGLDRNGTGYVAEWKLPSLLQRSECLDKFELEPRACELMDEILTPVESQCVQRCTHCGLTQKSIRRSRTCSSKCSRMRWRLSVMVRAIANTFPQLATTHVTQQSRALDV